MVRVDIGGIIQVINALRVDHRVKEEDRDGVVNHALSEQNSR